MKNIYYSGLAVINAITSAIQVDMENYSVAIFFGLFSIILSNIKTD